MKSNVQLILLIVFSTVKNICHGSKPVQGPLPWIEANQFCISQNSKLACITPEDISNTDLQHGQNFWIATHTTFSSWIKDAGYIQEEPNGKEFIIPKDDIFTCQLLCSGYTSKNFIHFVVKATKCLCFSDNSKIHTNGTAKAYEIVPELDINVHISLNLKPPCEDYMCVNKFSTAFLKPYGIGTDCFTTERYLVICASVQYQDQLQQCQPLMDFWQEKQYTNLECKLYKVENIRNKTLCGGLGNGKGKECDVAVEIIPNFVKGVGLTSSVYHDEIIFSCYWGMISTDNGIYNMTFNESEDCYSSFNFFCEKDVLTPGLCYMNPISGRSDTSTEQTSTSTGKEGMKDARTNVQTTRQDERTSSERSTDTQMASNNGIAIGVSVSICILVIVLVGLLIVIYCLRNKAKINRQNQSSNGSSFRNIAYESNTLNNTRNLNEPNTNGSDYDYIREDEYATIQSDTKNGGTYNDATYPQFNKRLLPRPKQDSFYTGLDKSVSSNVYDALKNNKNQNKNSQPRCIEPEEKSLDGNSNGSKTAAMDMTSSVDKKHTRDDENDCYEKPRPEGHINSHTKEHSLSLKSLILTNNLQDQDSQKDHNYLIFESESEKTNTENKSSKPLPDDYYLLKKDTTLSNAQMDQEGDYVDSAEGDYDHLNKKRKKGSIDKDQGNLYAHTIQNRTGEKTYDTAEGTKPVACIDSSVYDCLYTE